ncbi:glycosyltransferase family 2 protein [Allocoleopsis franciscana]|uniref:Putative glycosyltransferase n=1 Tax=Allocoleopsis franciscana PCC 7113 TaxID=1173027 RepID=K9W889_9CYAN|nr:glycosyltransferase family 2 protein [Allocoleopsis franciscana]AFZ16041.1 putative glycosyltransferase [Allocoleopsis franciscana PCC 7113]
MKITVIVPTYRRTKDLAKCLEELQKQTRPADEVILVVRDTDTETWAFLEAFNLGSLPLRTETVSITGVVAAMNTGLEVAKGDIIAFTDDDAGPHPDWLERIETYFLADDRVGGVGGRDWVYHGTELEDGAREVVGQVQWFGRVIGNHHIGVGEPREVDVLKGVNMSFRRTAIAGLRFDPRMRGTGAQVHFEVAFTLALRRAGWTLIYDPKVAVDHFRGQRFDEDKRDTFNDLAVTNAVHNETLILLEHFSWIQRTVFLVWAMLVGTRDAPGFLQWLRFSAKEGSLAGKKWLASIRGRWQGVLSWQAQTNPSATPMFHKQQQRSS